MYLLGYDIGSSFIKACLVELYNPFYFFKL